MRAFLLCSLLCAVQLLWGQNPSRWTTLDYDITQIAQFDERILFAHQLANDPRFQITPSEVDGHLIVSANDAFEGMDLKEAFDDFVETTRERLEQMEKTEKADWAKQCKAILPREIYLSLMMDVFSKSRKHDTCAEAGPFCTDNGTYMFPAGVNAGDGEEGPDYDCLHSTPNPAWYYMRIATPGTFTIHMYSTPGQDIDFCCWGPFDDPTEPCPYGLSADKVVSCSFSANATEDCIIPATAQTGEYYLLVITNFSNSACNIHFSKTDGDGTTDCSILPPLVDNDGPYCQGETIHLSGNAPEGAVYSWSGPNGWTATGQEVSLPNATIDMTGTYTCTISLNGQTSSADTYVEVNNPPDAVAQASPEEIPFGTSTTLSASHQQNTFVYRWEPANKVTDPEAGSTQTVALTEDTRFSLTVNDTRTGCTKRSTITVRIAGSELTGSVSVDDDKLCLGDQTTLHAHPQNGGPNLHFEWSPTKDLDDPYSQHPVVTPTEPGVHRYTCLISDGFTSLERSLQFSVGRHYNIPLEDQFCEGDTYYFFDQAITTPGHYSKNIPTNYYGCDSIFELELTMLPSYHSAMDDQFCEGESYNFYGQILTAPGTYSETLHTAQYGCDSIIGLTLTMLPSYQTERNQPACDSYTWQFPGNALYDAFTRTYTQSSPENGYQETVPTIDGCDSTAVLHLQLEYSPVISRLGGKTWVVGGSEFQYSIEPYWVNVPANAKHHTSWAFGDPNFKRWDLIPHGPNNDSCTLYIYTFEIDSIELVASTQSTCGCSNDRHSIWIHCGYYDVQEQTARIEILPNPNDGNMFIRCEGMSGDVEVKVFDLTGRLMDRFFLKGGAGTYQSGRCAPGVYCFALTSREGTLMKKVIIVE